MDTNAQNFKLMTYNLRYDNPKDSANNWQFRKEEVAKMIQKHSPDLLGTQEGKINQINELANLIPEYFWIGVGRDDGKESGELMAIFYKKDRLEMLDHGHFWLSDQPEIAGSRAWESACARMVTWAKFKDKQSEKIFFHFNSHFDHQSSKARKESAHLLKQRISDISQGEFSFFTADLNLNPSDSVYPILQTFLNDFRLSATKVQHRNSTFNDFVGLQAGVLIDFVGTTDQNIKANFFVVDESKKADGRFPSDHFPIVVELVLN